MCRIWSALRVILCNNHANGWIRPLGPTVSQWVNTVPPYVLKLHFMYEVFRISNKCRGSIYRTSSKCRWSIYRTSSKCRRNIYRTSSKCRWSIYLTSRKRRGTLGFVHKVEQSSPMVCTSWTAHRGGNRIYLPLNPYSCGDWVWYCHADPQHEIVSLYGGDTRTWKHVLAAR